jgi:Subtilisin inhibitor-like
MPQDADSEPAVTRLTITVWDHPQAVPRVWHLRCGQPAGDHPDPAGACAALDRAPDPFAPVPPNALCAQVYAGPQSATIEGHWRGAPIYATYKRTDACENRRWLALAAVLQPSDAP